MCVYMGSLVRSVIALHNLIDNKGRSAMPNLVFFDGENKIQENYEPDC
ncbi:hypothetical protein OESDEN_25320 [Oesophagostomum dentatum]|uniref:Uncharacterized protein n=1 Tax=Oesophagostomum dentatum TaxID=61180 RepID=A0A0B1RR05_OESDE|nr:hypothetical protein OESDEN_25320 [Oesophagostomum dentatum]